MASNDNYITYPIVADAVDLMQRAFDFMTLKFPGWEPSEGQLDTAILEAVSSEAADIASLTTEVPKSIYRYFGAKLMGVIPIDAVAATATTTWYAIDSAGYIIPDGTQVTLQDSAGNQVSFVTLGDAQIAPGSTTTDVGGVTLVAVEPGTVGTGLGSVGGAVTLVDILPWIDHVRQETVSIGGLDAESDTDYLNRLSIELQLITPRPILAKDFAVMARNIAGVQRATAIDGYNPADSSYGNERMVTVYALDAAGVGVSSMIKTTIQNYLAGYRELNFIVNTDNPTDTTVDVTANVLLAEGWSLNDVQYRVQQAIINYLNPAIWGIDPVDNPNDPVSWNNTTKVNYLELASVINMVPGVAYTISVTIGLNGGTQSASDKSLTGAAPVTNPGAIIVNVSVS